MQKNLERKIAAKLGLTTKQADETVNALLESLVECIAEDEDFRLRGFGRFQTKRREERQGRNPSTGEPITIKAKNYIKFTPYGEIESAIN